MTDESTSKADSEVSNIFRVGHRDEMDESKPIDEFGSTPLKKFVALAFEEITLDLYDEEDTGLSVSVLALCAQVVSHEL